jgi:hypothetical protein
LPVRPVESTEAEDSVTRSAAILATALKDGMGMLVQGITTPGKALVDEEAARRLDPVEKKIEAIDEAAKARHQELIALLMS